MKQRFYLMIFVWLSLAFAIPTRAQSLPVIPQEPRPDGSLVHVVRPGDTLDGILIAYASYGVTLEDLQERNGWRFPPDFIFSGQEVLILPPGSVVNPVPSAPASSDTAPSAPPQAPAEGDAPTTPIPNEDLSVAPPAPPGDVPIFSAEQIQSLSPVEPIAPFLPIDTQPPPTSETSEDTTSAEDPPADTSALPVPSPTEVAPAPEVAMAEPAPSNTNQAALQSAYDAALDDTPDQDDAANQTNDEPTDEPDEADTTDQSSDDTPTDVAMAEPASTNQAALQSAYDAALDDTPDQDDAANQTNDEPTDEPDENTIPTDTPPTSTPLPIPTDLGGEDSQALQPNQDTADPAPTSAADVADPPPPSAETPDLASPPAEVAQVDLASGQICVTFFQDGNQNGLMDGDDTLIDGGSISAVGETAQSGPSPICLDDQSSGMVQVRATAPDGYGITGPQTVMAEVFPGSITEVMVGVAEGYEAPPPNDEATAEPVDVPIVASRQAHNTESDDTLLDTLLGYSALIVLGLAALVFLIGSGLAIAWRMLR